MLMDEHETNYHCRHCEEERRSSPPNGIVVNCQTWIASYLAMTLWVGQTERSDTNH